MSDTTKFIIFFLFIVGVVGFSFHYDLHHQVSVQGIQEFILGMGVWGPVVYVLAYIVTSIVVFPNLLLSTASGAIWGAYLGTVYTVLAATFASIFPFFIAKFLGRDFVKRVLKGTKIAICDRFISSNGFVSVFIARLIPVVPWEVVNYGSGICGIRPHHYLLATFFGTIPASFTYNLIGSSLGKPVATTKIVLIFSTAIFLVLIAILYRRFRRS